MKIKYIVLVILLMLGFNGCNEEYSKVPFSVPIDFSKKGTVYETNFKAPWNIWGSDIEFLLGASYFINSNLNSYSQLTKEQDMIDSFIRGSATQHHPSHKEMMSKNRYFKIKITLTPLGIASNDISVSTFSYGTRKHIPYVKGKKIEEVVVVPLYRAHKGPPKIIMIADLQRLRNYNIRVESLENVEIPKGVNTDFTIKRFNRKH